MNIKENLERINQNISDSIKKSGRKEGDVKLLAVSKFHPSEEIIEAINAGQIFFGENRVQEACEKFTPILKENNNISLHLIGQLQSNKVKNIVPIAECIQSVDRLDLLKEIEKQCEKINKSIKVLFEIHTGEESKSGFTDINEVYSALELISKNEFPHIIPNGFMTMAPFTEDEKLIRKSFSSLRDIKEKMQSEFNCFNLSELSMGMSGDYKIAIEEGSTMVRIGTAIFGERNYSK